MFPMNHFSSLLNQDQRATALYLFDVGCGSDVVDELGWVAFALVAGDGDSAAVADLSRIVVVRVGLESVDFRLHGGDTGVGVRHWYLLVYESPIHHLAGAVPIATVIGLGRSVSPV